MKFRIVFWDVLPCKIIVDRRFNYFTLQYIPEDNSELQKMILILRLSKGLSPIPIHVPKKARAQHGAFFTMNLINYTTSVEL
jgi:hypothetical protein